MLVQFDLPPVDKSGVLIAEPGPVEGAWYRYEDHRSGNESSIYLRILRVVRRTKAGVWLNDWGDNKFVLNNARKRFAYPTIELARDSFLRRKRHHVAYLGAKYDHVQAVLKAAEAHFAAGPSVSIDG